MKKLFILTCALLIGTLTFAYSPNSIDEKLLHAFSASFPRAEKVSWQEVPQACIVSFVDNGIRSRITYHKDGTILSYIRYYFEEGLPVNIRLGLQHDYPNKKVWGVVEVSALDEDNKADNSLKTAWYIKLEGPSNWMTVKIDSNGYTDVIERYRKAK